MFDTHQPLSGNEEGVCVRYVSSPHYHNYNFVDEDEGEYILICDKNKLFSLIDSRYQNPIEASGSSTSYIRTDFKSGMFNAPASYVCPVDSANVGYILQSIVKTGNSTAYIGTCDFYKIKEEEVTDTIIVNDVETELKLTISTLAITPNMVWHGFFGQYNTYYPGNRNIIGDFQAPKLQSVGIDLLNTDVYSATNYFSVDAKTGVTPTLTAAVNANTIRRDTGIIPVYAPAVLTPLVDNSTLRPEEITVQHNNCNATDVNIYKGGYNGWIAPLEGTTADGLSHQSYTLCYPISLKGKSSALLASLITDPTNFLVKNGQYARPLCRAFHVYSLESKYSFSFTPSFFIPGPFIGVLLTWTPMTFKFTWTPYAVPTDKNMFFSSGMYANTDFIFSDIIYINIGSLAAGLRYQMLRSRRGSVLIRYKPTKELVYSDLNGAGATHFPESTNLFYLTNGLNPEEYMFCDGVLFGKQHFKYNTFTKASSNPLIYGGAWEPGEQGVILKGITLDFTSGLIGSYYTSVVNNLGAPAWKFTDINISTLSHGIGYINQIIQQFSDGGGLSDTMLESRHYTSSCQAPYDTIFCEGTESEKSLIIDDCLLLGMTSSQGFLDAAYDLITNKVQGTVTAGTTNIVGTNSGTDKLDVFTIILVTEDPELMYKAAVSYHHVSVDPGINGWYLRTLTGMNTPARITSGNAFLTGGPGYKHILLKQTVNIEYTYTFNINTANKNASAVFVDFPFGSCTSTISSAKISMEGGTALVPLVLNSLKIIGDVPKVIRDLSLNDGEGLTFPKICTYDNYLFTHSAKKVIMMDMDGVELTRGSISCVQSSNAEHTYIDKFDRLINDSVGEYLIQQYVESTI